MSHDAHSPQHWPHGYVSAAELRPRRGRRGRRRASVRATNVRAADSSPRRGIALIVVLTVVAILTVFVADLAENTSTGLHVTVSERDKLRAEYMAKSGLNLTRLLIAREPDIRKAVAGLYKMLTKRPPPQLNVWDFTDMLLAPFADIENARAMGQEAGVDFDQMEGIEDTHGTFEVTAVPENAKINLNKPLFFSGDEARRSLAMQLYALLGGYQSPDSPYDPMFAARDPDGHYTTRQDIVSAVIDWWDYDDDRTVFDPGASAITTGGSEDNVYGDFEDDYVVKNAPYDSLEELRLIRGIGDDFWATFIEDSPDDPRTRKVTIYGSGAVNVNLAPAEVLLARLCSFVTDQPLCTDPAQAMAFIQLFKTARSVIPVALFSTPKNFVDFIAGRSNSGADIYSALVGFLGADNPLMAWTPIQTTPEIEKEIIKKFLTAASIFTIQSVGRSGRAQTKMVAVVNFDKPWTPPRGVAGKLPALGVFHHFRME